MLSRPQKLVVAAMSSEGETQAVFSLLWGRWGIENSFKLYPEFGLTVEREGRQMYLPRPGRIPFLYGVEALEATTRRLNQDQRDDPRPGAVVRAGTTGHLLSESLIKCQALPPLFD